MMIDNQNTNKEALFNEVKGSLFEFLVSKHWAQASGNELNFIKSIDPNYLTVLSQQDRMVRQFYPELGEFLRKISVITANDFTNHLKEVPKNPKLLGKFSNGELSESIHETDILAQSSQGDLNISLKLNKKSSFVNTKSAGIKSFFETYFSFLSSDIQREFNQFVDQCFYEVSFSLHELNGWEYPGDYSLWVKNLKPELPGELSEEERNVLKVYYAKIASKMHEILKNAQQDFTHQFHQSLPSLMGFSSDKIIQLICMHDFKNDTAPVIQIHEFKDLNEVLDQAKIKDFNQTASVEMQLGNWDLQIRVKPMNKFTTTAMKINCSVRFRQS